MPVRPSGVLRQLKLIQDQQGAATLLREARSALATDPSCAAELAEAAVMLSRKLNDQRSLAAALALSGQCLWQRADYPQARAALRESIALHQSLGDEAGLAAALSTDGNVSQLMGDYAAALETQNRCLNLRRRHGDRRGEAATLNNLGAVYFELGEYSRSLEHHLESLEIKVASGDRLGEALSLGNLGTVYFELGDLPRALEAHQRSLALRHALGDRAGEAYPLGNLGELHLRANRPAEALECLNRALAIRRESGDRAGEALDLATLGRVQHALGDIPAALAALTGSLQLATQIGHTHARISALLALGNLQLKDLPPNLARRAEAWGSRGTISLYTEALQLAEQTGSRHHAWAAHEGLAQAYERERRPAEALAHFRKYHELKEQVLNEEMARRIARLRALHAHEHGRREQAGQRLRGRELARAREAARAARQARRELDRMIARDLGESLASLRRRARELAALPGLTDAARAACAALHDEAALAVDRLDAIVGSEAIPSFAPGLQRSPVMLDELLAGIAALHERSQEAGAGRPVRLVAEPCTVEADSLLIVEAFDSLLELLDSAAPAGAEVRIALRLENRAAVVTLTAARASAAAPLELEPAAEIIRRHGGELTAETADDSLTLRVSLPASSADGDPSARAPEN